MAEPADRHRHGQPVRLGDHARRRRGAGRARRRRTRSASSRRTARPTGCSPMPRRRRGAGSQAIIAGAGGRGAPAGDAGGQDPAAGARGAGASRRRSRGLDSLLSIVQMPKGVPVGTLAIGPAGAANAGLLAAAMLATRDDAPRRPARRLARGADRGGGRGARWRLSRCRPGSRIGILGGGQLGRMLAHGRGAARACAPTSSSRRPTPCAAQVANARDRAPATTTSRRSRAFAAVGRRRDLRVRERARSRAVDAHRARWCRCARAGGRSRWRRTGWRRRTS